MSESVGGVHYDVSLDLAKLIEGQKEVERRLSGLERSANGMANAFSAVTRAVQALAAGMAALKLVEMAEQIRGVESRLNIAAGSVQAGADAFRKLQQVSTDTQTSLAANADLFSRLNQSMLAMGKTQGDTLMMTEGLAKAIKISGGSAAEASAAILQFGQAMGSGKLAGDELRSLSESSPYLMRKLAEAIGVPIGELKKLGEDGKLTSEVLYQAMSRSASQIDTDFQKLPKTFSGAMQVLQDAAAVAAKELDNASGLSQALAKAVGIATEAIREMTQSVKQGSLTEYFNALKPAIAAAEVAVVSLAGALAGRLVVALAATVAQAVAAAGAMGAATIAARGFAAVVGMLGGPIGIAITALALLALNWDKVAGSAKSAADASEDAAQRIAKAKQLAASGDKSSAAVGLRSAAADYEKQVKELDKELARMKASGNPNLGPGSARYAEKEKQRDALTKTSASLLNEASMIDRPRGGDMPADAPAAPKKEGADAPAAPKKKGAEKKPKFDTEAYLEETRRSTMNDFELIDSREREQLAKAAKLRQEGLLSEQQHQEAVTNIKAGYMEDRLQKQSRLEDAYMLDRQRKEDEARKAQADKIAAEKAAERAAQQIINAGDPEAQIEDKAAEQQAKLNADLEAKFITEQTWADATIALHAQKEEALAQLTQQRVEREQAQMNMMLGATSQGFGAMAEVIGTFAGKQSSAYKAMFAASKAFAVAQAVMQTYQAAQSALASNPYPYSIALAAGAVAMGMANVAKISGANYGGGRLYGGAVAPDNYYRVNENGRPEMFTSNTGQQYLMPNKQGKVTPANKLEQGGKPAAGNGPVNVNVTGVPMPDGWLAIQPDQLAEALGRARRDMFI